MRLLIAAALLTALTGGVQAQSQEFQEFYVVQNVETLTCAIVSDYPDDGATQVMIANKFSNRSDAEDAMRTLRGCS